MMSMMKRQKREPVNDVGEWGEKDQRGAYDGPLNIGGEKVDVDKLPALCDLDHKPLLPAGTP